jgi:cell division septal protein FtsQ
MAFRSNSRRHRQPDRDKSVRFMRKEAGNRPVKIRKKSRLTARHIILTFVFLGIFFFGVERLWTFLITWEQLTISQVEIDCCHPRLNSQVKNTLSRMTLGNILFLNPSEISDSLKDLPWAASVRVRKIFPSTLRIAVVERKPWAVLKKDRLYLIDREGVILQPAGPEILSSLPRLFDREEFARDYPDKIQLAGNFLDPLTPEERADIAAIDLSSRSNMKIGTRFPPTELHLGREGQVDRFRYFQQIKDRLGFYGGLDYVDLRFKDRIYLKIRPESNPAALPSEQRR